MLSENEMKILAYLRSNGRHTVTQIGHSLGIPRTTVFDKIKKFKKLGLIKNFTCVINFEQLGHSIQANIFFKARENKDELGESLRRSSYTNTVIKIGNDYDFMASMFFPNMNDMHEYLDRIMQKHSVAEHKVYYVAKELKREGFMNGGSWMMQGVTA
jgi:DNA-binding Lrp family transcriptional regulator